MRTNNATGKVYRKSTGLIGILAAMVLGISLLIPCGNAIAQKWTPALFGESVQATDGQNADANTELPREWRWEWKAVTFDRMYRASGR